MRSNASRSSGHWLRLLAAAVLSLSLLACGFTAPRHSEGFANLESLGAADVEQTVSLSIGPTLLHFAAAHIDDEPEVADLLRGLDGVRIRVYEIDGDAGRVAARMNRMGRHLEADGWEAVALIREKGEETRLLVKITENQVRGMTFLSTDGKSEAVVINLMGDIRPDRFSDVMVALDVDAPGAKNVQVAGTLN